MYVIGKADKYYTLWDKRNGVYTFIKNISEDFNKARDQYPEAEVDLELRGYKMTWDNYECCEKVFEDGVLPFGAHKDKKLSEVPVSYLVWLYKELAFSSEYDTWFERNQKEIEKILERAGYVCFPKGHDAVLKEDLIETEFSRPEEIILTPSTQLSDTGVFLKDNMLVEFPEYKLCYYGDFCYGLPLVNGKGKKIKGKTIKITDYDCEVEKMLFKGYSKFYTERVIVKVKSWEFA